SIFNLAFLYQDLRYLKKGGELIMQLMETLKRVLCEKQSTYPGSYNLQPIHRNSERLGEAEKVIMQVLKTQRRRINEPEHINTLNSMQRLEILKTSERRLEEATGILAEVMIIEERVLGQEHLQILQTMYNLA
ncbi:hypothetical protein AOQ84DRAFT_286781, partial [Glonium stellatum]